MAVENVVSNIAPVLEGFLRGVVELKPNQDLNWVYDEELSYETALSKYRSDNNMNSRSDIPFPLFAFKRSVLRHTPHGASSRVTLCPTKVHDGESSTAELFGTVWGELEVPFMYIEKQAYVMEDFEIQYLSRDTFSRLTEFSILLEGLGELTYYVNFPIELEEKTIQLEQNYYKFVQGTAVLRGFYFTIRGSGPVITQINASIQSFRGEVLCSTTITNS